jgi:hypothetical protein
MSPYWINLCIGFVMIPGALGVLVCLGLLKLYLTGDNISGVFEGTFAFFGLSIVAAVTATIMFRGPMP